MLLTLARENACVLPVWLMTVGFTREAGKRAAEIGALTLLVPAFRESGFRRERGKHCAGPAAQAGATDPVSASLPTA